MKPITSALLVVAGGVLLLAAAHGPPPADLSGTVRVGDRPEANVVVWVETTAPASRPPRPVVLEQRNLAFSPHVLAVRAGTSVAFPNRDRVFHNVFSFHDGKQFDLGLYPVGTVRTVTFGKSGLSRIFCNIHPNMAAYVLAVDSEYFAVSDAAGRFAIGAVPAGASRYHAWRAGGAILTGPIEAGQTVLEINWP